MKYLKYITLTTIAAVFLWACKDEVFDPTLKLNSAPQITAPTAGTSIVLKEAQAAESVPAFTWSAADFGFASGPNYKLEIDNVGNNFSQAVAIGEVHALSLTISQGDLNNLLLAKGLEGEAPADLEIRVIASISDEVDKLISNPVPITITPYSATVVIPQLQVPGSYQGWDPANNSTIIYSRKSDNNYEGYLNIGDADAKHKFTQGPTWDVNWGDDGFDGTLDKNGADIPTTDAGIYKFNVNLNSLTYTQVLTNWGLIGSATPDGWNSDQNMTYDPGTGKISITLNLVAGDIKFRANDDWAINFGDDGNNKTLEYDGANIAVADPGNYTIDLLIVGAAKYKYAITKN